jgi:AcrR family transcriptional regulator
MAVVDGQDRRRARSEKAILDAARELIAERGVEGLTVEGVAARSGVAKTTIYRRWRDKDELALAILVDTTDRISAPPDLGDTRKELLTFVRTGKKVIGSGGIYPGLASEIATRSDFSPRVPGEDRRQAARGDQDRYPPRDRAW